MVNNKGCVLVTKGITSTWQGGNLDTLEDPDYRPGDMRKRMRIRQADGTVSKYKARFCAQGFSQVYGSDYENSYSNTVRYETIRILFAISARRGYLLSNIDISTAYLYAEVEKGFDIYMRQPRGYEEYVNGETMVCLLRRPIYGLKQSGARWEECLGKFLSKIGFTRCDVDPCLYKYKEAGEIIFIATYVDDLCISSSSKALREKVVKLISKEFKITDGGHLTWIFNTAVDQNIKDGTVQIHQKLYIEEMAELIAEKIEHVNMYYEYLRLQAALVLLVVLLDFVQEQQLAPQAMRLELVPYL